MRTKPGVDNLSIDDLYNNLRVFEYDIKGSTGSSSSPKNVAFVSSESTSSTNDVSTANGVSTSSGYNSQRENYSSYTDEIIRDGLKMASRYDFYEIEEVLQEDREKLNFDAKEPVGFDKTKVEYYNCHKKGHFARDCRLKGNTGYKSKDNGRRPGKQEEPKALVTLDGEGVVWTDHVEDEQENFTLMAYSNSGSDTKNSNTILYVRPKALKDKFVVAAIENVKAVFMLKRYRITKHLGSWLEFKNHLSDNEESLGEDASKQGRIDDADAEVTFIDETSNDARNKNNKISNSN
ncbi:ribonuclease H-like domain-containing protein [Tanacetum coccineum]